MGIMPSPKIENVQPGKFVTECSHKRQKYPIQTSELTKFETISLKVES